MGTKNFPVGVSDSWGCDAVSIPEYNDGAVQIFSNRAVAAINEIIRPSASTRAFFLSANRGG